MELEDKGSDPKCVTVLLQGLPSIGLIDSGADITIIGGELFKRITAVPRLKKQDFKRADNTLKRHDQRSFTLDGRLDLVIEFDNKVLHTPVYMKMDSPDQLLLPESVCRQLGVILTTLKFVL